MLKDLCLTNAKDEKMKWQNFNYLSTGGELPEDDDKKGWLELVKTI